MSFLRRNDGADHVAERITAEIARIEALGPPLEQRQATALARLAASETYFREHGFYRVYGGAMEQAQRDRQAMVGALMAVAGDTIREAERERVKRDFDAAGGGMGEAEKAGHLAKLRAELRTLHAKRELAWRQQEADGAIMERPGCDGEMFLHADNNLQRIADGREAA